MQGVTSVVFGSMTKPFGNLRNTELQIQVNTHSHCMNIQKLNKKNVKSLRHTNTVNSRVNNYLCQETLGNSCLVGWTLSLWTFALLKIFHHLGRDGFDKLSLVFLETVLKGPD